MMKAEPTSPFVLRKSQLAFQLLVVPFDAPSPHDGGHECLERCSLAERREPILDRLIVIRGPFNDSCDKVRHRSMRGANAPGSDTGRHRFDALPLARKNQSLAVRLERLTAIYMLQRRRESIDIPLKLPQGIAR